MRAGGVAHGAVGGEVPGALAAHLAPNERVIWHGGPAFGGLLHGGHFAALLICVGIAVGLPLMVALENEDSGPVVGIALAVGVVIVAIPAALMLRVAWRGRGTVYALTDRRLLTVVGGRIVQDCGPEDVHGLHETPRMFGQADLWWQVQPRGVGWRAVPEPVPIGQILEWRAWWVRGLGAGTEEFADAVRAGRLEAAERDGIARRIVLPATGVALSVPAGWRAEVAADDESEPVPLDRAPPGWTQLILRAPGAEVGVLVLDHAPFPGGFEEALAEDDAVDRAASEPALRIGPWRGFSLVTPFFPGWGVGAPLPHGLRYIEQRTVLDLGGGRWIELTVEAPADAQRLGEALAALRTTLRPA